MRDYLIRLAINYPHAYPWGKEKSKGKLLLNKEEIDNILQEEELNSIEKRREVGWRIQKIMYLNAVNAKDVEDLKEKIAKGFIELNYKIKILPMELIDETVTRKKLLFQNELELYKKFIAGKLTQEDYNTKTVCVQTWLTDILAKYYFTSSNKENLSKEGVLKFISSNIEDSFHKEKYCTKTIGDYLAHSGFSTKPVIQLYRRLFIKEHEEFTNLLRNVINLEIKRKAEPKEKKLDSFLDEINELLGVLEEKSNFKEISTKEETSKIKQISSKEEASMLKETSINEEVSNHKETSIKEEVDEPLCEREKTEDKNNGSEYEKLMSKYEELLSSKEKEKQILENKICDFLRKLVAPEEGAVLSELHTLYVNFEKIDKANVGATLSNFFNKLMLMGLEVKEEGIKQGDKVKFHSSELLKTYRVLRAVSKEGSLEGTIKYVGWNYEGKTLMQPVVRVNNK
jgi:hypothetical protein